MILAGSGRISKGEGGGGYQHWHHAGQQRGVLIFFFLGLKISWLLEN